MKLRLLLLLPMLVSVTTLSAQKKKKTREILTQGTQFVRFNFTSVMDPFETNLSFGYEYRFKESFSLAADLAWVFHSEFFQEIEKTNGVIFRPAFRWYPDKRDNVYCEAEIHYKHVNYTIYDWLGKDAVNGVPSYEELIRFNYIRDVVGFNIKGGYQEKITRNGRLWFEIYAGVGIRKTWEKIKNEPNAVYSSQSTIFDWNGGDVNNIERNDISKISAALPGGFRLLFRL